MGNRSNKRLNEEIERIIKQWRGTVWGEALKNMYKNGTSYEGLCDYIGIDYEDYEED